MRLDAGDKIFAALFFAAILAGSMGWFFQLPTITMQQPLQWNSNPDWMRIETLVEYGRFSDKLIWDTRTSRNVPHYHLPTACWENSTHCFELKPKFEIQ